MSDPISFDEYCELHGIQEHEYGAAFAAYLHEISGGEWGGQVRKVEDEPRSDQATAQTSPYEG